MKDLSAPLGVDDQLLERFCYRPQFARTLRSFESFAIGFSFISITTGVFTTFGFLLTAAGPRGIWTWPVVIGALAWLTWELVILLGSSQLRDAQRYALGAVALGALVYAVMRALEPEAMRPEPGPSGEGALATIDDQAARNARIR
jgi:hypothetical protein